MTIKRTYCADDSVTIASTSALELVQELNAQAKQGLAYVPKSLVTKTPFNQYLKISVKSGIESLKEDNTLVQWTHYEDGTSSAHSPLGDALLANLSDVLITCEKMGANVHIEQATLLTGVNSVKLACLPDDVKNSNKSESPAEEEDIEPLFNPSPSLGESIKPFELSVALSKESKGELRDYVAAYGITLDKRRSLTAMKGELKTITQK